MQESSWQRDLGVAVGAQCRHERWTVPGVALLDSRLRGNDRVKIQGIRPCRESEGVPQIHLFLFPQDWGPGG